MGNYVPPFLACNKIIASHLFFLFSGYNFFFYEKFFKFIAKKSCFLMFFRQKVTFLAKKKKWKKTIGIWICPVKRCTIPRFPLRTQKTMKFQLEYICFFADAKKGVVWSLFQKMAEKSNFPDFYLFFKKSSEKKIFFHKNKKLKNKSCLKIKKVKLIRV